MKEGRCAAEVSEDARPTDGREERVQPWQWPESALAAPRHHHGRHRTTRLVDVRSAAVLSSAQGATNADSVTCPRAGREPIGGEAAFEAAAEEDGPQR